MASVSISAGASRRRRRILLPRPVTEHGIKVAKFAKVVELARVPAAHGRLAPRRQLVLATTTPPRRRRRLRRRRLRRPGPSDRAV